jgi:hypothetical protein
VKAEPSPISARMRTPVRGPIPGWMPAAHRKGAAGTPPRSPRRGVAAGADPVQFTGQFGDDPAGGSLSRDGDILSGQGSDDRGGDLGGSLDAGLAGRGQRSQGGVAGQQAPDARLVQPLADGAFQGREMLVSASRMRLASRFWSASRPISKPLSTRSDASSSPGAGVPSEPACGGSV